MSNKHAWYSKFQARFGHCVWKTTGGKLVKATMITNARNTDFAPNIKDFEYQGEVVECVEPMRNCLENPDLELALNVERVENLVHKFVANKRYKEKQLAMDVSWGNHNADKRWNIN